MESHSNRLAILTHQKAQAEEARTKLISLNEDISTIEKQFILHQKVLSAFGNSGIPTLITHTILDDYQIEANIILDRLRPGLRLQFQVQKEAKKKSEEASETLDINYYLNNTELEFSQLSGAQKLIASLALRLGLVAILRKRLGIDLKLILIDEADQSLDEAALEAFEESIKELQKDYKILVITHNNEVKSKFRHAIVVEQDNDLNSTVRLTEGNW